MLSDVERRVLAVIQRGFPESLTPYGDMARQAGMETEQLLEILEKWKNDGTLRRIGAVVNHFKVGLGAAAMVVWQVDSSDVERVGGILAGFAEVSHAYERTAAEAWPYNVYTMVHAASGERIEEVVRQMSRVTGASEYRILTTKRELKKTPPVYIE